MKRCGTSLGANLVCGPFVRTEIESRERSMLTAVPITEGGLQPFALRKYRPAAPISISKYLSP